MGVIHSTKISGNFGIKLNLLVQSNWKSFEEKTAPPAFSWTIFPNQTSLKFVKWVAPTESAIHFAVARVGEFVRENASLGELYDVRRDKEI